jgi:hypothetical protein
VRELDLRLAHTNIKSYFSWPFSYKIFYFILFLFFCLIKCHCVSVWAACAFRALISPHRSLTQSECTILDVNLCMCEFDAKKRSKIIYTRTQARLSLPQALCRAHTDTVERTFCKNFTAFIIFYDHLFIYFLS